MFACPSLLRGRGVTIVWRHLVDGVGVSLKSAAASKKCVVGGIALMLHTRVCM